MVKYRRVSFLRPDKIDVSVKASYGKDNKKYALQISNLDRSDFKEPRRAINWKKTKINEVCYVVQGIAKEQSAFYDVGEMVTQLCFTDGRKMPLKYFDLKYRDYIKIAKLMFDTYATDGVKRRVLNHGKKHNY